MILTDEITLADLRTLGMCLSLIGSKISEDMVVQFEDSLLMKESPEEAVRPIVEDLFFNTRYCRFLINEMQEMKICVKLLEAFLGDFKISSFFF